MLFQYSKTFSRLALLSLLAIGAVTISSAQSWKKIDGTTPFINRILTNPSVPGLLIVLNDEDSTNLDISNPYFAPVGMGYRVSTDSGRSFSAHNLETFSTLDMTFSPTNPMIWYASVRNVVASGIAVSTDAGANWETTMLRCDGAHHTYRFANAVSKTHVARVNITRGVAFSDDGFLICTPNQTIQAQMRDVRISPISGAIFYAADRYNPGVYYSTDDAASFHKSETGLDGESVITVQPSPEDAQYVVCGTLSGLFASTNGGKDWVKLPYATGAVYDLAVHPSDPNYWCAATQTGVWISGNKGTGWEPHRDGLPNERVTQVAIPNWSTKDGLVAYAGVHKNGLYVCKPLITHAEDSRPSELSIVSQYPMPFTNELNLIWNAPTASSATITVRNQMGSEVYRSELVAQSGQNFFNWKAENEMPAGVYFVEIKTLDGSIATKVVKLN